MANKNNKCILCGAALASKHDTNVHQFIKYSYTAYKTTFDKKLSFLGGETDKINKLLRQITFDALCSYWDFFVNYRGDDWKLTGSTKDINGFYSNINRITQNCKIRPDSVRCHSQKTDKAVPYEFDLSLPQMWDYLNTMLDGEGAEGAVVYALWREKLEKVKNMEQLTEFDIQLRQHLAG